MSIPTGSTRIFQPGDIIGGRYQLESLLGQGGMSSVYKASDPNLKRTVAIKIIHPHLSTDPTFFGRFEQEAAAVAQLRHPNIYQVHDFNQDSGTYYMVMEYVEGVTLEARLKALNSAGQRMSLREATQLMAIICDAVDYAHQRGLIHRDLKPSNVMLNPDGEPILMDFGIARLMSGQNFTATGAAIGTAAYMSPEQARNIQVDHRTDIYALGVMLYEMVSGRRPFDGDSFVSVLLQHVNDPVPDIRAINRNTPSSLVEIIGKALAKEPAQRFNSANEMANALRSVVIGSSQQMRSLSGIAPTPVEATEVMSPFPAPTITPPLPTTVNPTPATMVHPPTTGSDAAASSPSATPTRGRRPLLLVGGLLGGCLLLGVIIVAVVFLLNRDNLAGPQATTQGMALIPGGSYTIGANNPGSNYAPVQQIVLSDFWLDKREVSNAEYAAYLADGGEGFPSGWSGSSFPTGQENHPVQGIPFTFAEEYCDWQGKRLPTEAEWEVAARGRAGLLYPWGESANLVTLPRASTYPVGSQSQNRSPFGIYDMAGNVWEWVIEPYSPVPQGQEVLRGGQYGLLRDMAYRLIGDPNVPGVYAAAGIRCAANPDAVTVVPDDSLYLRDDFTDPESGWPTGNSETGIFGYHPPGDYHVEVFRPNAVTTVFRNPGHNDYTIEVEVRIDHTDTPNDAFRYGLAFRRQGDNFYGFTISPLQQNWQVFRQDGGSQTVLAEGSHNSLRGLSQNDTLRVDASGDRLVFHINNLVVAQLRDSRYTQGEIGFYVETFVQSLAHIHYDSIQVREVEMGPDPSLLYFDDFTNPDSGWPTAYGDVGFIGYHPPDYYHVELHSAGFNQAAYPSLQFDDVTIEVHAFVNHTETTAGEFWYGVIARRTGSNYYLFAIAPRSGRWQISRHSFNGFTILAEGESNAITPELGENVFLIHLKGAQLALLLNEQPISLVEDDALTSGDIGFYVTSEDETLVHVHYTRVAVRRVGEDAFTVVPAATTVAMVAPTPAPTTPVSHDHNPTPSPVPTSEPSPTPTTPPADPANMVPVKEGTYPIGAAQTADLAAFWLDMFEVTNSQYEAFVQATGTAAPASWSGGTMPTALAGHPVEGVRWAEAAAYCAWAGKRLPTEAEWEAAARGPIGWRYPWGNNAAAVSLPASGTYPVGAILTNRSYSGAYDMAGNVWEWVDTPHTAVPDGQKVLRGGANNFQNDLLFRAVGDPDSSIMFANAGIRCAANRVDEADETVLLRDTFADINSGWWQARQPIGPYFYGYHPTDFYHMQIRGSDSCLFVDQTVAAADYVAQIDVFVAATETGAGSYRYGLAFRVSGNDYYALVVSPLGQTWQLLKSGSGGLRLMAEGAVDSLRGHEPGLTDRLAVVANGPAFALFVNGELVGQAVDGEYAAAHIGFYIGTLDEPYIHIHFDTVEVRPLPANAPAAPSAPTGGNYPRESALCGGSVSAEDTLTSFFSHTVAAGETMTAIAARYGLTLEALMGANGRSVNDANLIRPGQTILIPQE